VGRAAIGAEAVQILKAIVQVWGGLSFNTSDCQGEQMALLAAKNLSDHHEGGALQVHIVTLACMGSLTVDYIWLSLINNSVAWQ